MNYTRWEKVQCLEEGEFRVTRQYGNLILEKKIITKREEPEDITGNCHLEFHKAMTGRGYYIKIMYGGLVVGLVNPYKGIEARDPFEILQETNSTYSFKIIKGLPNYA